MLVSWNNIQRGKAVLTKIQIKTIFILSFIILPIGQVLASSVLPRTITIQPIVLSDDDGSHTATFFGSDEQQVIVERYIDGIWSQAGINVSFLDPTSWNNSFANSGTSNPRPEIDLHFIFKNSSEVRHDNLNIINMFFVNMPPGFGSETVVSNSANGLAFIGTNGIAQFVGEDLLGFTKGQKTIASVVAHEIGHNLGLEHVEESRNLMGSEESGIELTENQIAQALSSRFTVVSASTDNLPTTVPVPAAVWLFGSGLMGLLSLSRRKVVLECL